MSDATQEVPMVNVQIDGVWMQFPKGTRMIEACRQAGKEIPHYCYHPKLTSPGNCRMCLVEMGMPPRVKPGEEVPKAEDGMPVISWMPRPTISCANSVAEGMGIRTDSKLTRECREGVMEFLLINHPLDCPICDQAGECKLQEFSVEYGTGGSRFLEQKVQKPKKVDLGPRITLDDERCILCSRCIRFTQEIAEDDALGFVNRGSYSTLTCHPGRKFDNNYTLNTVDICPVGALTSKDFRFQMRVWFMKETKSICTSCGMGCNTTIGSRQDKVFRQTPRDNDYVNECWMCDHGRLNFHYLEDKSRFTMPMVRMQDGRMERQDWTRALSQAAEALREAGQTAIVASGSQTNEEYFLLRRLALTMDAKLTGIVPHEQEGDHILVSRDGNANTNGAKLMGIASANPADDINAIKEGVRSGSIQGLIVYGEDISELGLAAEDLQKLKALVFIGLLPNTTSEHASVILPSAGFAEKRGSMINVNGRLQRLNRAVESPGDARDDWEILRDLKDALGGGNGFYMIEEVFREMAREIEELNGLTLTKIGDSGAQVLDLPREEKKIGKPDTVAARSEEARVAAVQ